MVTIVNKQQTSWQLFLKVAEHSSGMVNSSLKWLEMS